MTQEATQHERSRERPATTALAGVRVLDLSRVLAGPYAAQILGDLGADVVKVERPGSGDESRGYGPPLHDRDGQPTREGAMYLSANRNKRSIAIDLATVDGQSLVRDMAAGSDVLVENYKAGSLAAYGLAYADLAAINPRLVYCSITGYGQTGPYADRPGYDTLFQAQSGMMSLTGLPDDVPGGGPLRVGFALVDVMSAYHAVIAIQAALWEREHSGQGQHIDLALLDCATAAMSHVAQAHLVGAPQSPLMGNGANGAGPSEVLNCRDGRIYVTAPSNALFSKLCKAIGRTELASEPRFATSQLRSRARNELVGILNDFCADQDRSVVCERLGAAGIPAGFVNDLAQAFADPHATHRRATVTLPHAHHDELQLLSSPLRLSRTPPVHHRGPPVLGQHTDEVLAQWLGLDAGQVDRLRNAKIVA